MKQNKTALVTGASAGIGAEFARQLANNGYSLVLTARREDRLQNLAKELMERYPINCTVIAADLADPNTPKKLCQQLSDNDIEIQMLVNNAGYGVSGTLTNELWQTHQDFLQVMVTAPAELCYRLLPDMQQAKAGSIINVASLAALVPGSAGHTLYAASKAFMVRLSESLLLENERYGIRVQALCPGFTYSEFHDVVGTREMMNDVPDYMWMSAEDVVAESLKNLADSKSPLQLVSGKINPWIARLARWLPPKRSLNLVRKRSRQFRKSTD